MSNFTNLGRQVAYSQAQCRAAKASGVNSYAHYVISSWRSGCYRCGINVCGTSASASDPDRAALVQSRSQVPDPLGRLGPS